MGESSIEAYVQIKVLIGMEEEVLPLVAEIEGVKKTSIVVGGPLLDGAIVAEVYGEDLQSYTEIIREIRRIRGVHETASSIVVSYKKK